MKQDKEVWLRGQTVDGITPLLQPVAHALLQAGEELENIINQFPLEHLWNKPAGCASVGFHLLHIAGVLDRLLSYAEGKNLTESQLLYLKKETLSYNTSAHILLEKCKNQITISLERLNQFSDKDLMEKRGVGRAKLPSTVMGLCTHAAEHTMRHVGQLLVTAQILNYKE